MPFGGVPVFECGASAQMDGVIVTVVHDEFRGMGLSGVLGFVGEGAVTGGWYDRVLVGWAAKSEYENSDAN